MGGLSLFLVTLIYFAINVTYVSYFEKQVTDLKHPTIKGIFINYFQDFYNCVHDVVSSF